MANGLRHLLCCGLVLVVVLSSVVADTPANCTYEEVQGTWVFMIGERGHDNTVDCSKMGEAKLKLVVDLNFPDSAVDQYGNKGFWTLVYNQGFEVVVGGRKYFAFSKYDGEGSNATSYCDQTLPGWSHNVLGTDWACYEGRKMRSVPPKHTKAIPAKESLSAIRKLYKPNHSFINKINKVQSSWKAVHYKEYESMTVEHMLRRNGGRKSKIYGIPKPAKSTPEIKFQADQLPLSFDWRNVNGVNFVSPIRNQGGCGSCYAFSSMGMHEARLRVMTNNTNQAVLSPQDVVECSEYSQGCEGGFPYLIAGKYAEDFGLVTETCSPYKGKDGKCSTPTSCLKQYGFKYSYVGGFYGGCNQDLMKIQLVKNGPMSVSFEVYDDFMHYKTGVYSHTGLNDGFNPFHITNHAVLLVGYGIDTSTSQPYWTVKNSWGTTWGEEGYFRILRGTDECSIESIAVESFPIL